MPNYGSYLSKYHLNIPSRPEILIGIIGVTGAGKTTFISKATGNRSLAIGHGLDACTPDVEPVRCTIDGRQITLLDTPGFDDSSQSDADILQLIANYLAETYKHQIYLTGIIFLQPISNARLTGSEAKRTRLFKRVLGDNAYERVVIATTQWEELDDDVAKYRTWARESRNDVWGDMVSSGARVVQHRNTEASAKQIVRSFLSFATPVKLLMQEELAKNGGKVMQTSAGRQMNSDLDELVRQLRGELDELRRQREATQQEREELLERISKLEGQKWKLGRMTPAEQQIAQQQVEALEIIGPIVASATGPILTILLQNGAMGTCTIL